MIWDGARSVIVRTDRTEAFNRSAPAFLDITPEDTAKYLKGVRTEPTDAAPATGLPAPGSALPPPAETAPPSAATGGG